MLEARSPLMNLDCQLLLLNMKAHEVAIQLLRLPFNLHAVLADDLEIRAVCLACYRLIKASTVGGPKRSSPLATSALSFF